MKKQVFSCIIAAVMMLSAIWTVSTKPASAASSKPFMSIQADENGKPRDKVGKYYIWVENSTSGSFLKCAQSLSGKKKTLKAIKGKKFDSSYMNETILTDGATIYYSVHNYSYSRNEEYGLETITVYKTTVNNAKHKKIAVIAPDGPAFSLVGYQNGKLYYHIALDCYADQMALFSYDCSKKTKKLITGRGCGDSSYGQYILVRSWNGDSYNAIYSMKTKKFKKLPIKTMNQGVIYDKNIYYTEYKEKTDTIIIKKCNLSGKKIKTLKKLKNADTVFLGKKAAYYKTGNSKKIKKVIY